MTSRTLTFTLDAPEPLGFALTAPRALGFNLPGFTVVRRGLPAYEGPVSVTPGEEAQVLATENTSVLENITVGPVPSNYGRILWDGSVLTVY